MDKKLHLERKVTISYLRFHFVVLRVIVQLGNAF
jgi:hypothetical protein